MADLTPPKALLFDLDGTLLDSMPFYEAGWVHAFRTVHKVEIDPREPYILEGAQAESFVIDLTKKYVGTTPDAELVQKTYRTQREYFDRHFVPRFFDGAVALIAALAKHRIPLGLVSGSKRQEVELKTAQAHEFMDAFRVIVTGEDTPTGKPTPAPYLRACEKFGVAPKDALVIENAPLGIRSAVGAGCECWVVLQSSPLDSDTGEKLGAGLTVRNTDELADALSGRLGFEVRIR